MADRRTQPSVGLTVFNKMNTMTTANIIAIQKEIIAMGDKKTTLLAAADAAEKEIKTAAGYKIAIAKAKLRDAETAITEHDAAAAALEKQLPQEETKVWFCRQYAAYELKRDARLATITVLEVKLAEAQEEAKKGAWKWVKAGQPKETSSVTAVRAQISAENTAIAALDEDIKGAKKIVDQYKAQDASDAEFAVWLAGGPKPEYLRIRDEIEHEQFLKECVSLKLPRRGEPYTIKMPVVQQEEVEEPTEWVSMSMEQWALSLMQKPEQPVEVEVFKPSVTGKTPAWITRIIAARAAKKATATVTGNPMLTVMEVA
jgi:hypothetical protein